MTAENLHVEYLDLMRHSDSEYRDWLQLFLENKYARKKMDLVITFHGPALDFLLREGEQIWPRVPVLALWSGNKVDLTGSCRWIGLAAEEIDYGGTLELALRLFPKTRQVLFVCGSSETEQRQLELARMAFDPWLDRLTFEFTFGLALEDIFERITNLPADSIILCSQVIVDGRHKVFIPRDVFFKIGAMARVPVFSPFDTGGIHGILGGSVRTIPALAAHGGETAAAILKGTLPRIVSPQLLPEVAAEPLLDWSEVARFKGDIRSLPPETVFRNRPVTIWSQYRSAIIGSISVFVVLTALIVQLLVQNYRRRLAEVAARESEERFRQLFDQAPDGIVLVDAEIKRIVFANPAAERIFGCSNAELLQSELLRFYPEQQPDGRSSVQSLDENLALTMRGEKSIFERTILGADGTSRECEVRSTLLSYLGRKLVRLSYIDITERKAAEEERKKLNAQLLQAQKMESVGLLAGGVAHDYNNLLSVVIGYAELALEKTAPTDPLHQDLQEIHKAGLRSAEVTSQLLAFARKQVVHPKVLDLNRSVEGMLKMLRRLIGEHIELFWRPGADLWPIKIDPIQLDQILANLCVNARDAIGDIGTILIVSENCTLTEPVWSAQGQIPVGDYVRLTVRDDGAGIAPDAVEHIFEPFYTTKEIGKGTGLGLATIYGIVTQNQGFISVESGSGSGTAFSIFLPRQEFSQIRASENQVATTAATPCKTVLLVDDEHMVQDLVRTMIERLGHTVLTAGSPEEAIDLAEGVNHDIDILVTDMIMPGMNGRDLYERLQSQSPGLKVLYMTGYSADFISSRGILLEGIHLLQKPFSSKQLADGINRVLEESE